MARKNWNYLKSEHYADFANYLTNFTEEHRKLGLELYAISPQNEPEYGTTDWDGCIWWPHQTAKFVKDFLKPTLLKRNFRTKVIIGETGNWNVAHGYLVSTSLFLKENDFDIYASHGYSLPDFPRFETVTYNTRVIPWVEAALYKKERWITEASATDKYDPTIVKGIEMANSIIKFLVKGYVNGYIFWCSVINVLRNEGLIVVHGNDSYTLPKVYDVYGQFTRNIKQGNIRAKAFTKSSDINVVVFKDENKKSFSVVVTNFSQKSLNVQLVFDKLTITSPSATITDKNKKWYPLQISMKDNKIIFSMTPMSVVTVVGFYK
ncbi:glycosyl hydrolase-like protein [Leptotrombidium deliense]|uniref:Glycosyl hydrolase-like protein n=1 Tax=Leptotrombidium deliense TaxID=299467 RepID=A0A443S059_9ACAR|nr:glycosyl hydrolase-like protein [Leptotrombidium deliense]